MRVSALQNSGRVVHCLALALLTMLAGPLTPARADDDRHAHGYVQASDVDFDSLHAELRPRGREWELRVEYDVQIEDPTPGERFVLLLTLTDRGVPLVDEKERPLTIELPLDRPSDVDDDEIDFEGGARIGLPIESIRAPWDVCLRGEIVSQSAGGEAYGDALRAVRETRAKFRGQVVVHRPAVVEVRRPRVSVRVYGCW